jgi:type I restriction-modification system DNA methylase subunit
VSHDFKAMKTALRSGNAVQVVAANQLFPTPPDVARRMVELLDLDAWNGEAWETCRVLEPSAGTGSLLEAVLDPAQIEVDVIAVEVNQALADSLRMKYSPTNVGVICADFLEWPGAGLFDAVLMNPPYERGAWERHLRRAWQLVRAGGRLVAVLPQAPNHSRVCAELCDNSTVELLPDNTFAHTGVRTCIVVLDKPEAS